MLATFAGEIAGLAGAPCWGVSSVLSGRQRGRFRTVTLNAIRMTTAGLLLVLLWPLFGGPRAIPFGGDALPWQRQAGSVRASAGRLSRSRTRRRSFKETMLKATALARPIGEATTGGRGTYCVLNGRNPAGEMEAGL